MNCILRKFEILSKASWASPLRARHVAGDLFFGALLIGVLLNAVLSSAAEPVPNSSRTMSSDIVVYGGTSGGVVAAVKASRMGKS
ncbi:MAG: hypothetical protein ACK52S_14080, partial [Pirellula sp.]